MFSYVLKIGKYENETSYVFLHNDKMDQYTFENNVLLAMKPLVMGKLSNAIYQTERVFIDFGENVIPYVSLEDIDFNEVIQGMNELGFSLLNPEFSIKMLNSNFTPTADDQTTSDTFYDSIDAKLETRHLNVGDIDISDTIITSELYKVSKDVWQTWIDKKATLTSKVTPINEKL